MSATCRYSSWERAFGDGEDDGEESSLVDSLTRILNNTPERDSEDGSQEDKNLKQEGNSLISKAKADVSELKSLALELCSTDASVTVVTEKS